MANILYLDYIVCVVVRGLNQDAEPCQNFPANVSGIDA
jgi:hypothetical protein